MAGADQRIRHVIHERSFQSGARRWSISAPVWACPVTRPDRRVADRRISTWRARCSSTCLTCASSSWPARAAASNARSTLRRAGGSRSSPSTATTGPAALARVRQDHRISRDFGDWRAPDGDVAHRCRRHPRHLPDDHRRHGRRAGSRRSTPDCNRRRWSSSCASSRKPRSNPSSSSTFGFGEPV
jgi:hypothetical protein